MNINDMKTDILEHKCRLDDIYSDSVEITLPLFKLYDTMMQEISKIESKNFNISNSEFDVLITTLVAGNDSYTISPTILYDRLLFSTGAITKLLNKLESKNLIERIDNEFDKRSKLLRLTPLGKKTCEDVFIKVTGFQESIYSVLSKSERETFIRTLYKILKEL